MSAYLTALALAALPARANFVGGPPRMGRPSC